MRPFFMSAKGIKKDLYTSENTEYTEEENINNSCL